MQWKHTFRATSHIPRRVVMHCFVHNLVNIVSSLLVAVLWNGGSVLPPLKRLSSQHKHQNICPTQLTKIKMCYYDNVRQMYRKIVITRMKTQKPLKILGSSCTKTMPHWQQTTVKWSNLRSKNTAAQRSGKRIVYLSVFHEQNRFGEAACRMHNRANIACRGTTQLAINPCYTYAL